MVKIAHAYAGQTRPSAQGLRGFDVQYNPNMFGAALGTALGGFAQAMDVSQDRRKENSRFDTLIDFTEFETSAKLEIERLKQDTPENAANFLEQAESVYTNAQSAFLNNVPPELQNEFEYRAAGIKQGVIFDAFKWDFEQQNLFFSNKINEKLTQAQVKLAQAPDSLEEERQFILETIDASGLTEIEKERQKRIAQSALEAITYRAEVKNARKRQLTSPSGIANKDLPPAAGGILNAIAKRESGGKYDIRYDGGAGSRIESFVDHPRTGATITSGPHAGQQSTAAGKYQFIGSTWDAAAAGAGVRDFSPESQDAAGWYWAQKTYADATGRRESLTAAIAAGKWGEIKAALGTQWEGVKGMSDEEFQQAFEEGSGVYADISAVQNDPRFGNLAFDTRMALEADGRAAADAEYNALLDQQRKMEEQRLNSLYVGLFDGKQGLSDIESMREEGILRDYDDISKAYKILDDRLGKQRWYREGESKLTQGGVWVPQDDEDKKRANALFGDSGRAALEATDQAYVSETLLPRYAKMQMVAPDQANMLTAMTRDANAARAAYAFEALRQMRETAPEVFGNDFPEELQKKLDHWELRRNYAGPEELVAKIQNRGTDQAARQAQSLLRADAKEAAKELTVEDIQPIYESVIPWQSAEVPLTSGGKTRLEREFRTLFEDAFVETDGNADEAKALAEKRISRVWALSNIGGGARISKFPPEVAGYKPFNGDYKWIDRAVERELALPRGTRFELLADEITEKEIAKRQQSGDVRPSYRVFYTDSRGVVREARDADGDPIRMDFVVDKETLAEADASWRKEQRIADREFIKKKYLDAKMSYDRLRGPIPAELEESYRQVIEEEKQEGTARYRQELRELGTHLDWMSRPAPVE